MQEQMPCTECGQPAYFTGRKETDEEIENRYDEPMEWVEYGCNACGYQFWRDLLDVTINDNV